MRAEIDDLRTDSLARTATSTVDGVAATRIIKSRWPKLPVLAITGDTLQTDVDELLDAGAEMVIRKPVKSAQLRGALISHGMNVQS